MTDYNNIYLDNASCKIERIEHEDNEKYKIRTEIGLKNSESDFALPKQVGHVKVEHKEGIVVTEASSKNTFIEPSKCTVLYKTYESFQTSTEFAEHKDQAATGIINKNPQLTNQDIKCDVSRKTFNNICNLKDHMRVPTVVNPFTCSICNKSYARLSSLKLHEAGHTGNKPYSCNVCNKTYTILSYLKEHERIHINKKPHKCKVCNKAFLLVHRCLQYGKPR